MWKNAIWRWQWALPVYSTSPLPMYQPHFLLQVICELAEDYCYGTEWNWKALFKRNVTVLQLAIILKGTISFQTDNSNTSRDMNYCLVWLIKSRQTDRRTESDAEEPTVQNAQVGSKTTQAYSPGCREGLLYEGGVYWEFYGIQCTVKYCKQSYSWGAIAQFSVCAIRQQHGLSYWEKNATWRWQWAPL